MAKTKNRQKNKVFDRGDWGDDVAYLQSRLNIEPTGVYDEATEAAVRAFQKRKGLQVDGVAGKETTGALRAGATGTRAREQQSWEKGRAARAKTSRPTTPRGQDTVEGALTRPNVALNQGHPESTWPDGPNGFIDQRHIGPHANPPIRTTPVRGSAGYRAAPTVEAALTSSDPSTWRAPDPGVIRAAPAPAIRTAAPALAAPNRDRVVAELTERQNRWAGALDRPNYGAGAGGTWEPAPVAPASDPSTWRAPDPGVVRAAPAAPVRGGGFTDMIARAFAAPDPGRVEEELAERQRRYSNVIGRR